MKKTLLILTLGISATLAPTFAKCPNILCVEHTCQICRQGKDCSNGNGFETLGTFAHLITKKNQEIQAACYTVYKSEYEKGGISNEKYGFYSGGVDGKKFNPSNANFGGINVKLFKSCESGTEIGICDPSPEQLKEAEKSLGN
jgi:hypothetical protein